MKSHWMSALLGVCLALTSLGSSAAAQSPDQAVRQTTEKLRTLINKNHAEYQANSAKFYKVVDDVVVPRFDIPYIGQIVLGGEWRKASKQQRQRFSAAFKNNLVHSYAQALLKYHDTVKEEWQPLRLAAGAKEATVHVDLLRDNAPPLALGFEMHLTGGQWKVYDVNVEGLSLAANFRAQFGAEIRKNGLDSLIARLEGGSKP